MGYNQIKSKKNLNKNAANSAKASLISSYKDNKLKRK